MKNRAIALKVVRITAKIALCLAAMITISLAVNYIVNLQPDSDGFYISTFWARTIHGDIGWTWQQLTDGLFTASLWTSALVVVNTVLDVVAVCRGKGRAQ